MKNQRIKKNNKNNVINFKFPSDLANKGNQMLQCYYQLFCLENYLRLLIEKVAQNKFGNDYWNNLKIKTEIQQKIESRKEKERQNKWLSLRGNSNLFYTDLDELRKILISNWLLFERYFPEQEWITYRLKDVYQIRNRIAHNSYIDKKDQKTLETFANNIYDQLEAEINLNYPTDFILKKYDSGIKKDDKFAEFQEFIYTQDFKKIFAKWNKFEYLFPRPSFSKPFVNMSEHRGCIYIFYNLDKIKLNLIYEGTEYSCEIINSKNVKTKHTDEGFNSEVKKFFENISDSINIY